MYNLNIVIMKKYFYLATALVALAACSSNDFFGDQEALNAANGSGAISFNSGSNSITRASGAEAATLLNNNFVIEGIKTTIPLQQRLLKNEDVRKLKFDNHWLEKYLAEKHDEKSDEDSTEESE